jgi:hypothetical protein
MKKIICSGFVLLLVLTAANSKAFAQKETDKGIELEKDLELLRRDLRSEKKKLIALNVPLTEIEATKFWPVYDQYAEEMRTRNDEFYAIIKDYAAKQKTLSDADAIDMIKRWSDVQVKQAQTRQKYVPLIEKIPEKRRHFSFKLIGDFTC